MHIAMVLYDRFTALDIVGPYEALSRIPDARVDFVAETAGPVRADTGFLSLVADRARDAVKGLGGPVTASIGVASFPADGSTAEEILLAADRACFVVKRDGRDRVASAAEGLALAAEFSLQAPTPVDSEAMAGR